MDEIKVRTCYPPDHRAGQTSGRTYRAEGFSFALEDRNEASAARFFTAWLEYFDGIRDAATASAEALEPEDVPTDEQLGLIARIAMFDKRKRGEPIYCHAWTRDKDRSEALTPALKAFFAWYTGAYGESSDGIVMVTIHGMPRCEAIQEIAAAQARRRRIDFEIKMLQIERDSLTALIAEHEAGLSDIRAEYDG